MSHNLQPEVRLLGYEHARRDRHGQWGEVRSLDGNKRAEAGQERGILSRRVRVERGQVRVGSAPGAAGTLGSAPINEATAHSGRGPEAEPRHPQVCASRSWLSTRRGQH